MRGVVQGLGDLQLGDCRQAFPCLTWKDVSRTVACAAKLAILTDEARLTWFAASRRELAELAVDGVGIHHAGMLRSDRNLVERLFREGLIKARQTTILWTTLHMQQCHARSQA